MHSVLFRTFCRQCQTCQISSVRSTGCLACGDTERASCHRVESRVHDSSRGLQNAFCLRTSRGPMLRYTRASELHIGVCDSRGIVHAFERGGVKRREWKDCLAFRIEGSWSEEEFHNSLVAISGRWKRKKKRYHVGKRNCFDFVLAFLRSLGRDMSKRELSHIHLCPLVAAFEFCLQYQDDVREASVIYLYAPRIRELCHDPLLCDMCRKSRKACFGCRLCRGQYCAPCMELHIFAPFSSCI